MSAVREAVRAALAADSNAMVVGSDVGRGGGAGGWSAGLLDAFGHERVVDVPVADRGAIGFSIGLAMAGRKVVLALDGVGRLGAVVEALASAAEMQLAGGFSLALVALVPYGTEAGGLDHPVGQWANRIPGLPVVCGSSAAELGNLVAAALAAGKPAVVLAPRRFLAEKSPSRPTPVDLARVREVRSGEHVTLASWGTGVATALEAADTLASEGISAGVVDLVALSPVDRDGLGEVVRRTGRLVVVHPEDPSLAGDIAAVGLDEAFLYLEAPLARVRSSAAAVVAAARDSVHY